MTGMRVTVFGAMVFILPIAGCGNQDELSPSARQPDVSATATPEVTATEAGSASTSTPALPTEAVPADNCSSTIIDSHHQINSIDELAWMSHRVIVGRIVERQKPFWGDVPNPEERDRPLIFTNYVVEIEQTLRGRPDDAVGLQRVGGTIGDCTQRNDIEHQLSIGDDVLLFLRESEDITDSSTPTYFLTGGNQGYWPVTAERVVNNSVGHLREYSGMSLASIATQVHSALRSGIPQTLPQNDPLIVPLDVSPIGELVSSSD